MSAGTPEYIERLTELGSDLSPLMRRFGRLAQEEREAVVVSMLGGYVRLAEEQSGDMADACKRTVAFFDAMLKQQETK